MFIVGDFGDFGDLLFKTILNRSSWRLLKYRSPKSPKSPKSPLHSSYSPLDIYNSINYITD